MAYLTITRIEGEPDALAAGYHQASGTMNEVGRDHGLLVHAAARADDGLVIVNLWPSRQGSEAAARDPRRLEVVARNELAPGQIRPHHYDVEGYVVFG